MFTSSTVKVFVERENPILEALIVKRPEVYLESKARALKVMELLEKEHSDAKIALQHNNPLELLVSTILSAQCTDERVNKGTKTLFKK